MAVVEQLIRAESDGSISFGNYELPRRRNLRTSNMTEMFSKLRHSRILLSSSATRTLFMNRFPAQRSQALKSPMEVWNSM